jgi:hypothetical protein
VGQLFAGARGHGDGVDLDDAHGISLPLRRAPVAGCHTATVEQSSDLVVRAAGRGRTVALAAGIPLLLVGLAILATGRPGGAVLLLAPLWALTTLRQRAVLGDRELVVQGRFTRRRVSLADVEATAEDRTHVAWVQAAGQRPFRIYLLAAGNGTPARPDAAGFVRELRRRATAAGARVDAGAETVATPPRGTSPLFSL